MASSKSNFWLGLLQQLSIPNTNAHRLLKAISVKVLHVCVFVFVFVDGIALGKSKVEFQQHPIQAFRGLGLTCQPASSRD